MKFGRVIRKLSLSLSLSLLFYFIFPSFFSFLFFGQSIEESLKFHSWIRNLEENYPLIDFEIFPYFFTKMSNRKNFNPLKISHLEKIESMNPKSHSWKKGESSLSYKTFNWLGDFPLLIRKGNELMALDQLNHWLYFQQT